MIIYEEDVKSKKKVEGRETPSNQIPTSALGRLHGFVLNIVQ